MIQGHHDALARALTNVMLNAVDACARPAGTIGVRVRRRRPTRGRDAVELAVSDNGCGIPREQLARIWDPYVTSKPGGTGLGLAIARQTVLAHDGGVVGRRAPSVRERRFDSCCRSSGSRTWRRSGAC